MPTRSPFTTADAVVEPAGMVTEGEVVATVGTFGVSVTIVAVADAELNDTVNVPVCPGPTRIDAGSTI